MTTTYLYIVVHTLDGNSEQHPGEDFSVFDNVLTINPKDQSVSVHYPLSSVLRWEVWRG